MANFSQLVDFIEEHIYPNDSNSITGQVLQNTLLQMVSALGGGALFKGMATKTTNPGSVDSPVFYFAKEAGVYEYFGGITLVAGLNLLYNNSGSWSAIVLSSDGGSSQDYQELVDAVNKISNELKKKISFVPFSYTNGGGDITGNVVDFNEGDEIPAILGWDESLIPTSSPNYSKWFFYDNGAYYRMNHPDLLKDNILFIDIQTFNMYVWDNWMGTHTLKKVSGSSGGSSDLSNYYTKTETNALLDKKTRFIKFHYDSDTVLTPSQQESGYVLTDSDIESGNLYWFDNSSPWGWYFLKSNGKYSKVIASDLEDSHNLFVDTSTNILYRFGAKDGADRLIPVSSASSVPVDLSNYYTKSETYARTDINNLIAHAVDTEKTRAESAESTLNSKISKNTSDLLSKIKYIPFQYVDNSSVSDDMDVVTFNEGDEIPQMLSWNEALTPTSAPYYSKWVFYSTTDSSFHRMNHPDALKDNLLFVDFSHFDFYVWDNWMGTNTLKKVGSAGGGSDLSNYYTKTETNAIVNLESSRAESAESTLNSKISKNTSDLLSKIKYIPFTYTDNGSSVPSETVTFDEGDDIPQTLIWDNAITPTESPNYSKWIFWENSTYYRMNHPDLLKDNILFIDISNFDFYVWDNWMGTHTLKKVGSAGGGSDLSNYYTKTETNALLDKKTRFIKFHYDGTTALTPSQIEQGYVITDSDIESGNLYWFNSSSPWGWYFLKSNGKYAKVTSDEITSQHNLFIDTEKNELYRHGVLNGNERLIPVNSPADYLSNYYNKTQVNSLLSDKATKTYVDSGLANKLKFVPFSYMSSGGEGISDDVTAFNEGDDFPPILTWYEALTPTESPNYSKWAFYSLSESTTYRMTHPDLLKDNILFIDIQTFNMYVWDNWMGTHTLKKVGGNS